MLFHLQVVIYYDEEEDDCENEDGENDVDNNKDEDEGLSAAELLFALLMPLCYSTCRW